MVKKHYNQQRKTKKNIKHLYNSRQRIIDLLNDNANIRSEAIYKSKQDETKGKGLKILTPKQMLQRLPVAFAQIKAGNNQKVYKIKSGILFILCINQNK